MVKDGRQKNFREKIFEGIKDANDEDNFVFGPDEIPNPELLKNFSLRKKYAIFMQKFFVYKLNIYNDYEFHGRYQSFVKRNI